VRIQPAIKAAVSFGAGIFITFSQSHSPEVGLYTLAVYGLIVGLSSVALAFGRKIEGALQELPMATLATLIGIFALLAAQSEQGQLTATWGLISGAFGLYQARRFGFKELQGRDHLLSSIFALVLGALFLGVELDPVSAVGFFGAYLALDGVHWGIAAASPKGK
jgi:uncharacterized membrane protein HdeD (DUF308 family)